MMVDHDVDLFYNMALNGTDPLWGYSICLSPWTGCVCGMFVKMWVFCGHAGGKIPYANVIWDFIWVYLCVDSVDSHTTVHQNSQSSQLFTIQYQASILLQTSGQMYKIRYVILQQIHKN